MQAASKRVSCPLAGMSHTLLAATAAALPLEPLHSNYCRLRSDPGADRSAGAQASRRAAWR